MEMYKLIVLFIIILILNSYLYFIFYILEDLFMKNEKRLGTEGTMTNFEVLNLLRDNKERFKKKKGLKKELRNYYSIQSQVFILFHLNN